MKLEGIHHVTAITGDAPRNVDFYTRVLGLRMAAKTVNQDDPTVYHLFYADERGRAGRRAHVLRVPGRRAGPRRRGHGAPHRLARGVADGARLLGRAARRRGGRDRARRRRACASPTPRASAHELVVDASGDEPLGRRASRRSRPSSRCRASRACAPTAPTRAPRRAARAPARRRAARRRRLGAARRASRRHLPPRRRRPTSAALQGAGTVHHVAWGTTVAEHPRWFERIQAAGVQLVADHRPPLLPLDLLPRAGRRAVRDRRRRPGLHGRRAARGAGLEGHPAAGARAPPRRIEANLTPLPDPRAGWATVPGRR